MTPKYTYKTGVTLSGGATRGYAHLGALKALNERGVKPDVISGVSSGAVIGALYADGYSPDEIFDIFKHQSLFKMVNISIRRTSLFKKKGLTKILIDNLRSKTFEELNFPLFISAANLNTGEHTVFSTGRLLPVLRASTAVPILFQPVKIDGNMYVDGGLLSNMPVKPLSDICKTIIGVNVNPIGKVEKINSLPAVIDRTLHLGISANVLQNISKCHIYIEPPRLKNYSLYKSGKENELFDIGYEYTHLLLDKKDKYPLHKTDTSSVIL